MAAQLTHLKVLAIVAVAVAVTWTTASIAHNDDQNNPIEPRSFCEAYADFVEIDSLMFAYRGDALWIRYPRQTETVWLSRMTLLSDMAAEDPLRAPSNVEEFRLAARELGFFPSSDTSEESLSDYGILIAAEGSKACPDVPHLDPLARLATYIDVIDASELSGFASKPSD